MTACSAAGSRDELAACSAAGSRDELAACSAANSPALPLLSAVVAAGLAVKAAAGSRDELATCSAIAACLQVVSAHVCL